MLRRTRRMLLGPVLALCAAGAVLVVDMPVADAATSASVRVRGTLKIRAAATTNSAVVGTLRNRASVAIVCRVTGQYVRGTVRRTAQWDRLTSGRYISHAYVSTNTWLPVCAPPPAAPAAAPSGPLSTISNASFIASAVPPAQASQREFRVPASVTIAQAILESGWGKSGLALNDRNYFGMKCFGLPGSIAVGCHDYRTLEWDGTKFVEIVDRFKVYQSVTDSFRDHGRLLATSSRYSAAFTYVNNANQFVAEVHKGGYATDPEYTNKLVRLMTLYNLHQYDLR